jgi:hypothetical protein
VKTSKSPFPWATSGMWVYNDKLQINFTLRSGPVIFWPSCDPWTLEFGQIFSCHHFLRHAWIYLLEFGIWVYNDELQIKFTFHPGSMIFGRVMALGLWNFAKYLVVSPLYFTMIWYAVLLFWYECIIISYRSTLKFVPVECASHYNSKYQKSSQYLKAWWQLNIWPKLIDQGA